MNFETAFIDELVKIAIEQDPALREGEKAGRIMRFSEKLPSYPRGGTPEQRQTWMEQRQRWRQGAQQHLGFQRGLLKAQMHGKGIEGFSFGEKGLEPIRVGPPKVVSPIQGAPPRTGILGGLLAGIRRGTSGILSRGRRI